MKCKRAKLIMLPTEDKSVLSKAYLANPSYLRYNKDGFEYDSYKYNDNQHLYITTDDEIKEGDWCIDTRNGFPEVTNKTGNFVSSKKIIATTDKSLTIGEEDSWKNRKDILYPNTLPQPSQAFIEKYCKVGGIDEVLVEYKKELAYSTKKMHIKDIPLDYDIFKENETLSGGKHVDYYKLQLKIDSHNTITIHPIKDSWSKEELYNEIEKHYTSQKDKELLINLIDNL